MNPLLVAAAADKLEKANEKERQRLAEKRAARGSNASVTKTVIEEIPSWAKGIIVVGVVGAAAFLIYKVAKSVSSGVSSLKNLKEKGQLGNDEKTLQSQGVRYSFLQSQYNSFADKIFSALKGATEDEDMIMTVMASMRNDLDVLALIKAYGVRDASFWGWEKANYDLITAINAYMSTSEVETYVNAPLRANGITYQF
jgi:hypothetical protein